MCAGCVQIIMPNPATEHCDLQRFSIPAYFSAGSSAGPARNRRSFAPSLATKSADLQAILAGATGLEPATSGVTGMFQGSDDWRRLTRNRSIHAPLRAFGHVNCARLRRPDFERLLPFCCPSVRFPVGGCVGG
jgi:hypothetical protein